MPGKSSDSKLLTYVGVAVALVAVVGTVALGWEFGDTDNAVPLVLGSIAVVVAVGWELYTRTSG